MMKPIRTVAYSIREITVSDILWLSVSFQIILEFLHHKVLLVWGVEKVVGACEAEWHEVVLFTVVCSIFHLEVVFFVASYEMDRHVIGFKTADGALESLIP